MQGREIAQISSSKLSVSAAVVSKELSSIASAAASTYRAVGAAAAPTEVAPAAGLLEACLAARATVRSRWRWRWNTYSRAPTNLARWAKWQPQLPISA